MERILEVIAFNVDCSLAIEKAGAQRIELCTNPHEGGTTPSYGMIKITRQLVTIDLFPMIRPRGGNFNYSETEFEVMKADIAFCRDAGCDGIVTGVLNKDGTVNKTRLKQIVEIAAPLGVTFHRAFDRTPDPRQALEDIIECGCERILTSGESDTAMEGSFLLSNLVKKAGDRIIIMPGSGIRSSNLEQLIRQTGAVEFHTSARHLTEGTEHIPDPYFAVDANEVEAMVKIMKNMDTENVTT